MVHPRATGEMGRHGSIPARAGETAHVGVGDQCGPSPRVRGKREPGLAGSIPARAGETNPPGRSADVIWTGPSPRVRGKPWTSPFQRASSAKATGLGRVHPRACGGNDDCASTLERIPGSIPARAGEKRLDEPAGSIPARAGETYGRRNHPFAGSIPARAGETQRARSSRPAVAGVHPRACGGNPYCHRKFTIPSSSSEKTRQTLMARF